MRTKGDVIAFLQQHGFEITTRPSYPRATVRNFVYGQNRLWKDKETMGKSNVLALEEAE